MKRESQRWIARFLTVLMMGGLLVVGATALDRAWAAGPQIFSGLMRSNTGVTHCSVVNTNQGVPTAANTFSVVIEIIRGTGAGGIVCDNDAQTIEPGEARGVTCNGETSGVYCQVTGTTAGNFPAKARGAFSVRNANGGDEAVQEMK